MFVARYGSRVRGGNEMTKFMVLYRSAVSARDQTRLPSLIKKGSE